MSLLIVNIDGIPVAQYDQVFKTVGLDVESFVPASTPLTAASWPTLGSMIDSGKRLVTFMDHGADASVPYIIDGSSMLLFTRETSLKPCAEFTNVWETAFNVVDTFDCNVNRTSQGADPTTQMYLINHFLDKLVLGQPAPFVEKLGTTNAASGPGSLGEQVDTCVAQQSRPPNFLLVDVSPLFFLLTRRLTFHFGTVLRIWWRVRV